MRPAELWVSIVGAFVATLLASFFSPTLLEAGEMPMILASTGAHAMLLFGLPHAPVCQPWNVVGGANVPELGYAFVIIPVFFHAIILLSIAMAAGTLRDVNPYEVE